MGKQRRQRWRLHRRNGPLSIGLPSVKGFGKKKDENFTKIDIGRTLQVVYNDLQSCNLEVKLCALQVLESLSCDTIVATQIAKDGIAKIVGPLLMNHDAAMRRASASALRSVADHDEACDYLFQDNILAPLIDLFKRYSKGEPKDFKESDAENERKSFVEVVILLGTLCEKDDDVVKVHGEDMTLILLKFLDIDLYGIEVVIVVMQCLSILTEDNIDARKELKPYKDFLCNMLKNVTTDDIIMISEVYLLKITVTALLLNIENVKNLYNSDLPLALIINMLVEILSIDNNKLLSSLMFILPDEKVEMEQMEEDIFSSTSKVMLECKRTLVSQQQALEILTNLCFDEDEDETTHDSDMNDFEMCNTKSTHVNQDSMDVDVNMVLPVQLVEAIRHYDLIDKIWEKTVDIEADIQETMNVIAEGKVLFAQISTIKSRAYACLGNIMPCLEIDAFGGAETLYKKWLEIYMLIFKKNFPHDCHNDELLEASTTVMRAILQKLIEAHADVFKELTVEDINPIIENNFKCSRPNIHINVIRILFSIAIILRYNGNQKSKELIKIISIYLLKICESVKVVEVWILAECIDALFDLYADNDTNHIAADIGLIPILKNVVPYFKEKVLQQKRELGDHAVIVFTVNANLRRFIRYKEKKVKRFEFRHR